MTDFIYRKENALSLSFCRSLIELFEIDKERQHRGVIRKEGEICLLYTSPSPRDMRRSRMPSSA